MSLNCLNSIMDIDGKPNTWLFIKTSEKQTELTLKTDTGLEHPISVFWIWLTCIKMQSAYEAIKHLVKCILQSRFVFVCRLIFSYSWWKSNKVQLHKALLSLPDYMLEIGKLWLLSADVWRKRCWGMARDDNVAWSRAPSSHIEKRRAESRNVFEVNGMCIFPFWLSVLLGPVSPS